MALIQPTLRESDMVLRAPGMLALHIAYDTAANLFLPGTHADLTIRATQCLTDFSFDFERTALSGAAAGPNLAVSAVSVDGAPAAFAFEQPTYPGNPNGPNDPDPAAHAISNVNPVSPTNPNPPACSPQTSGNSQNGLPCPANKLVIIANSFLGVEVGLRDVAVRGITALAAEDLASARRSGQTIRLVASATRRDSGGYTLTVEPVSLEASSFIAQIDGWEMGIEIESDLYGVQFYKNRESEPLPTAAAMLRDAVNLYSAPDSTASSTVGNSTGTFH